MVFTDEELTAMTNDENQIQVINDESSIVATDTVEDQCKRKSDSPDLGEPQAKIPRNSENFVFDTSEEIACKLKMTFIINFI